MKEMHLQMSHRVSDIDYSSTLLANHQKGDKLTHWTLQWMQIQICPDVGN